MAKNWIQNMHMKKGALTNTAKSEGKTLDELCSSGDLSSKTKRRCALRDTLMRMKKK